MEYLLLLCFSLIVCFSSAADTISTKQSLSGNQTIISRTGSFELGFFRAGNSSNFYIGIWLYKEVPSDTLTIVWVANRETPVSDRFNSELKIVSGNLVLFNESKVPIWSTNITTSGSDSVIAVLLDDANLVLRDGSKPDEPLWQSFDNPAHTWLPGAKLAYDRRTKKSQRLTSWRSNEDPGVGLFSMELNPSSKEYVSKWNGSQQYWTSGPWNGQMFSFIPEMRLNNIDYIYKFSFFSNENESYFTYSLYNSSIIPGFAMDVSGQVQQLTNQWNLFWAQPRSKCQVYALCGAYGICRQTLPFCNCLIGFKPKSENDWNQNDFSSGCVRNTDLECGDNKETSGFLMVEVVSVPPKSMHVTVGSDGECRTNCLNNCRCNAYSFSDNQCSVWEVDLLNISEGNANGKAIYIKVASKDLPPRFHKRHKTGAVIGSIASVVFVLGLIMFTLYRHKWIWVGKTRMDGSLVAFVYRDLQIATKNFSDKLGGGGFGSVFKGVLRDSSVVAVKKLESVSQGEKQFRSEVSTIGTIQHVNLVRLRGFCGEGNRRLLVYDYMPNGSLDFHLFRINQENILDWKTRYQIAVGIASGLVYLHEKCRDCIIHCDIKPENILLDADFCPKVADFGLAKLVGRDFSRVLTTMRGTPGYLAPEWLSGVPVTAKADVFSYGMLLFELVHGKRNSEQSNEGSGFTFFPSIAVNVVMGDDDILSLLDIRLNREASVEEVTKILKVAYWCIQDEEKSRPSMSQVEHILEGVVDVNMPPIPQSLKFFHDDHTMDVPFFNVSSSIFNESASTRSSQVQSN